MWTIVKRDEFLIAIAPKLMLWVVGLKVTLKVDVGITPKFALAKSCTIGTVVYVRVNAVEFSEPCLKENTSPMHNRKLTV